MRRARPAWSAWLAQRGVVALEEVDTRALVRRLRENGAMRCALGTASPEELHARALARAAPRLAADAGGARARLAPARARRVRRGAVHGRRGPARRRPRSRLQALDRPAARRVGRRRRSSFPGTWDADAVLELEPAAVLVGNGPGDPAQLDGPVETVRDLLGRVPLFGICLGHQLVGLALGLETFKLPFGHRGANHPVRVTGSKRVLVTAQNHGFAVDAGRRRRGQPRLAQRRHRRRARGRRLRDAPVPSRGRARTARRRSPSSTGSPTACRSAPTFAAS